MNLTSSAKGRAYSTYVVGISVVRLARETDFEFTHSSPDMTNVAAGFSLVKLVRLPHSQPLVALVNVATTYREMRKRLQCPNEIRPPDLTSHSAISQ